GGSARVGAPAGQVPVVPPSPRPAAGGTFPHCVGDCSEPSMGGGGRCPLPPACGRRYLPPLRGGLIRGVHGRWRSLPPTPGLRPAVPSPTSWGTDPVSIALPPTPGLRPAVPSPTPFGRGGLIGRSEGRF